MDEVNQAPLVDDVIETLEEPLKRPIVYETRRVNWPLFQPDTTIVIPVMNESANVLPLVRRIRDACRGQKVEVRFIDDSRNALSVEMAMLARMMYRSHEFDVRIHHRLGEQRWGGLSGAVTDGIRVSRSDRIIVMDGDLQHPPETIPAMIRAGQYFDIVMASRYRKGGSASGLDGGIRHLVSRASTELAKFLFPIRLAHVTDPMTGFFLINKSKVDRTMLRPKGFKILLEILGTHPKLTVADVPLQFAERVAGESHGTMKQGLEYLSQLIYLRFHKPIRLFNALPKFFQFGAIGGGVFVAGMALLYLLVSIAGMNPLVANAVQLVVTFWLNYTLNKQITWRERTISPRAAHRFLISRTATTVLNYLMFAWLITVNFSFAALGQTVNVAIGYITANVITLLLITALNYVISDRWAFAEPKDQEPKVDLPQLETLPLGYAPASPPPILAPIAVAHSPAEAAVIAQAHYMTADPLEELTATEPRRRTLPIGYTLIVGILTALTIAIISVPNYALAIILAAAGFVLFLQATIEVWRMVYAYREPEAVERLRFPEPITEGFREKILMMVPARHEGPVLAATLKLLAKQTHPNVEILSVICDDDDETLAVAYKAAEENPRIRVMEYPLAPHTKPSKPLQLNYVLRQTADEGFTIIGIADAEDTVHPELMTRVEAAFRDQTVGIVQGGVQLMNHDSSWFSLHNVLEYYRWFNSAMMFQSDSQFMPLGGNTIFIRRELLDLTDGWPVTLTEDCSLGVMLSARYQTKTAVYYEPWLATREETPETLGSLFKQRVRWNQGFFHEWRRGIWKELPSFKQRALACYVLLGPLMLAIVGIFMLVSLLAIFWLKAPVALVLIMYLPIIPVVMLGLFNVVFLHDFGKSFKRKITIRQYLTLLITQPFYPIVLNTAALWSVIRELRGNQSWHKTEHSGMHRDEEDLLEPAYAYVEAKDENHEGDSRV